MLKSIDEDSFKIRGDWKETNYHLRDKQGSDLITLTAWTEEDEDKRLPNYNEWAFKNSDGDSIIRVEDADENTDLDVDKILYNAVSGELIAGYESSFRGKGTFYAPDREVLAKVEGVNILYALIWLLPRGGLITNCLPFGYTVYAPDGDPIAKIHNHGSLNPRTRTVSSSSLTETVTSGTSLSLCWTAFFNRFRNTGSSNSFARTCTRGMDPATVTTVSGKFERTESISSSSVCCRFRGCWLASSASITSARSRAVFVSSTASLALCWSVSRYARLSPSSSTASASKAA